MGAWLVCVCVCVVTEQMLLSERTLTIWWQPERMRMERACVYRCESNPEVAFKLWGFFADLNRVYSLARVGLLGWLAHRVVSAASQFCLFKDQLVLLGK